MAENPQKPVTHARPLSPHLQIYSWPVTMATSITHRATGIALSAGLIVLTWWLVASASGPEALQTFNAVAVTPIGQIVLFGLTWSLAYHWLNGIRHLAWDLGYGFELPEANASGVAVVVLSVLLAIGAFAIAYAQRGIIHL